MSLSYREVAEILKIIDASSCEELVLELDNTRLVVRRGENPVETASLVPEAEGAVTGKEHKTEPSPGEVAGKVHTPNSDDSDIIVRSPMAGTFYSRPSPDEPSFVDVGTKLVAGDTLCLIEVMKLYTTIEATTDGIIESILAEDGNLVEFDQPLFVINNHG